MPISFYITVIVMVLLIILLKAILRSDWYANRLKANAGMDREKEVRKQLRWLPRKKYRVINNLLLSTSRGTTEIDHLVVSQFGIFIIETKNMTGTLHGSDESQQWTLRKRDGSMQKVTNPVRQNYAHKYAVLEQLQQPSAPYIQHLTITPVVVFSRRANLQKLSLEKMTVLYIDDLGTYLREKRDVIMTQADVQAIYEYMQQVNRTQKSEHKAHVEQVKDIKRKSDSAIQNNICPRCGKPLQLRIGQYGQFYGCTGYPQCRFTAQC